MTNHLIGENSPYLLQHALNPVDWYPWDTPALDKAQREDKPIFLSIGYAACHWCHVMAHESFEDPGVAAIMNENFVNIKVDREERPDLDSIYMSAVVAMTGQGGWPMSVFLTPKGEPFYGGTYFPPTRRYNLPSFKEILLTVARLWREDRVHLLQSSQEITNHLKKAQSLGVHSRPLDAYVLEHATTILVQSYDWQYGGWGDAPKFPQPMAIEFLLQRATQGDVQALKVACHNLDAMARGGMYDVVGGGFARYSTDKQWLVPHFEKMLYDNAQLSQVYLHAYLITGEKYYRRICESTLDFMAREMFDNRNSDTDEFPSGGFFSSLDADSEGEEGKFYLWSLSEIKSIIEELQINQVTADGPSWIDIFMSAFEVTETGNFEGKNILRSVLSDKELAERYRLSEDEISEKLNEILLALLKARNQRVRPSTDDKVLVSWNALALNAFSEAARYLERSDYLEIARRNADFLLSELYQDGNLMRSWRANKVQYSAFLEDYAGLAIGLVSLYQSDPDPWWFSSAVQLVEDMITYFKDPNGIFFESRSGLPNLLLRPKEYQDNATPSGNALAVLVLSQLAYYEENGIWRDEAERVLSVVLDYVVRYPLGFGKWLHALNYMLSNNSQIAILGNPDDGLTRQLVNQLWSTYRPNCIAAISDFPPPSNSPTLLRDRPLINDRPTAYVCQNLVCKRPVNSPQEFLRQLQEQTG
jgi:uncharacterized protein YyaL (SSP411 family)